MKPKKHPTKDLNSKRGLYFIIGLIVLLLIIYAALEWRTPFDDGGYDLNDAQQDVQKQNDSSVILRTKAVK